MEVFAAGYRFPKPSVAEFVLGDGFRPIVDASEYRITLDAEQFSAAVGAFRVIAEIGGLLRAPIKPPEAKG